MIELEANPLRAPGDGGPGFCYDADRDLFRGAGELADGPLLVALDSNIIIDLEQYGASILDSKPVPGLDVELGGHVEALGQIIDFWMMRDIRFVVVPRTRWDFRHPPKEERMVKRERTFARIEAALCFQADDWGHEHERFPGQRPLTPTGREVLDSTSKLDALMLLSAWDAAVDIFLTRDAKVLSACQNATAPFPAVLSPTGLAERLSRLDGNLMFPGQIDHDDCRWAFELPFGDTGKWVSLFEAMSI